MREVEVRTARARCERCLRPQVTCYCEFVPSLPTRTRVVIVQHPREEHMAIGTARMAHLALPSSVLRVGLRLDEDAVLQAILAGPQQSYVLFPGPSSIALSELPRDQPINLVVVDGTWSQAKTLLRVNRTLAALPRVGFNPSRPSSYQIRRQPAAECVSTIEALAEVLTELEPGQAPFEKLLDPFHAMVARQAHYASEVRQSRHARAHPFPRPSRRKPLARKLREGWERIVCIQGDANGWPRWAEERQPPETVHWVACRPATGETYEAVIAPRRPLAPATARHLEIAAERLLGGVSVDEWHASWRAFVRPDDIIVYWGRYYRDLSARDGLAAPTAVIDLRADVVYELGERVGTIESALERLALSPHVVAVSGRAGKRLAGLLGVVHGLKG